MVLRQFVLCVFSFSFVSKNVSNLDISKSQLGPRLFTFDLKSKLHKAQTLQIYVSFEDDLAHVFSYSGGFSSVFLAEEKSRF